MSFAFSTDEVFALAEKIEKNGAEFYKKAAAASQCDKTKDLLNELAAMEVGHEKAFAEMRKALPDSEKSANTFDPENETMLYLESLANSRVFTSSQAPIPEDDSCSMAGLKDVLDYAVAREKDSIAFYLGMKDLLATESGKCKVDEIIAEEMQHIRMINNQIAVIEKDLG